MSQSRDNGNEFQRAAQFPACRLILFLIRIQIRSRTGGVRRDEDEAARRAFR